MFPSVVAVADPGTLKGRRFGNVVLVGSHTDLPVDAMPRVYSGDPLPAKVVSGRELRDFTAGAPIVDRCHGRAVARAVAERGVSGGSPIQDAAWLVRARALLI